MELGRLWVLKLTEGVTSKQPHGGSKGVQSQDPEAIDQVIPGPHHKRQTSTGDTGDGGPG